MVGHAAVFDKPTRIWDFNEVVRKGAFLETLADDVRALFNHDPNWVLGRTIPQTLQLAEDDKGLEVRITPPDNQWANDLLVSVKRGDISQMSFAFEIKEENWIFNDNELPLRELRKVKLYDVSIVTYPAYEETDISVRKKIVIPQNPAMRSSISMKRKLLDLIERS